MGTNGSQIASSSTPITLDFEARLAGLEASNAGLEARMKTLEEENALFRRVMRLLLAGAKTALVAEEALDSISR